MEAVLGTLPTLYLSHLLMGSALAGVLVANRRQVRRALDTVAAHTEVDGPQFSAAAASTAIGATLLLLLVGLSFWVAGAGGLVVFFVARIWFQRRRHRKYVQAFDKSLAESLMTIASSLKAGLTLKDALVVAADNCPYPFNVEVMQALKEYRFGVPLDEALDNIRGRIGSTDAKISFGAIIIGSQLGGRLPEILQKIVKTVRERERVEGRLKSLTAQGRSQAFLLCSAPPVLGVGMWLYDPVKMGLLTDTPVGQVLLGLAIALELIGIAVMSRIMKLEI